MNRNHNQLILAQRTSIGRKVLKGIGGTMLLSMLIFGALSVKEQESVQATQESQATSSTSMDKAQASQSLQQEQNTVILQEVAATATAMESEAVEASQEKAQLAAKQSATASASVSRLASVKKEQSSQSAVQFAAVQASLNANGDAGMVHWSTLMEQNSKHFVVERSLDGETFEQLGSLAASGGKGIQKEKKEYSFEDLSLAQTQMPRAFYRIKQVGWDGKSHYTDVVEHDLGMDLGLYSAVVPKEDKPDEFEIRFAGDQEGEMTMRIFKASGEVMVEQKLTVDFRSQSIALETAGWDKGAYFLQLVNQNTSIMEQFELN